MNFPLLFLALLAALPPLKFNHVALGNVARVLSARFHVPVTLYAQAKTPITGDFSNLDLVGALTAAAKEAGLEVKPLGKLPKDGYALRIPAPDPAVALAAAAKRREELLHQRALLEQSPAQPQNPPQAPSAHAD